MTADPGKSQQIGVGCFRVRPFEADSGPVSRMALPKICTGYRRPLALAITLAAFVSRLRDRVSTDIPSALPHARWQPQDAPQESEHAPFRLALSGVGPPRRGAIYFPYDSDAGGGHCKAGDPAD